jgi:hypothetical protein
LTSAHCVIDWRKVGVKANTGAAVYAKMRAYAHKVRPRRNGDTNEMEKAPHGVSKAQHAYYKSADWPNVNPPPAIRPFDYDYAVLSLRTPPTRGPIPLTKVRVAPTPGTQLFEAFHYPFAFQRGFRMFHSAGDVGPLTVPYTRVYTNRISSEPGSSGGGVYELGAQGVVGLITAEKDISPAKRQPDQKLDGYVNSTLLFTSSVVADINFFILGTE